MDSGTVGEDSGSGVNVNDPRTMAKAGCPDCLGRGVRTIIRVPIVTHLQEDMMAGNPEGLPELCHCVVSYLKSNPITLLEFLKAQGMVH